MAPSVKVRDHQLPDVGFSAVSEKDSLRSQVSRFAFPGDRYPPHDLIADDRI
jgi:hypothetical protein